MFHKKQKQPENTVIRIYYLTFFHIRPEVRIRKKKGKEYSKLSEIVHE